MSAILDVLDAILRPFAPPATRSASEEFGPTPGARYERELTAYTDAELIRFERDDLLAAVRADSHTEVSR